MLLPAVCCAAVVGLPLESALESAEVAAEMGAELQAEVGATAGAAAVTRMSAALADHAVVAWRSQQTQPTWDPRVRRHLAVNDDCRTNLKLVNFDKWCSDLPIATCTQFYYVVTTNKLKVPHTPWRDHTHTHRSRAETIVTTSTSLTAPSQPPHPPCKECQVREGRCKAFTTNRVVGCTGSEVRHAFEWRLIRVTQAPFLSDADP